MAEIQPLHAVHYDTHTAGALENLVAPPYDVIDDKMRAELIATIRALSARRDETHGPLGQRGDGE